MIEVNTDIWFKFNNDIQLAINHYVMIYSVDMAISNKSDGAYKSAIPKVE